MAYLTAKVMYPSRKTFTVKTQGKKPSIYWERRYAQFFLKTYPGIGRPKEGKDGLEIIFDVETARALRDALNKMLASKPMTNG